MALAELMLGGRDSPLWDVDGRDWPNRRFSTFVHVGGLRWHVQRRGRGPVLLLLHGTGAATHSWRDLMPILAERFDVVAPDLPGHGFTRWPNDDDLSLDAMAKGVGALLRQMDVAPEIVVGHSAGAAVAVRMVLDGAMAPRAVVGLDAALVPWRGVRAELFPLLARAVAGARLPVRLFAHRTDAARVAKLMEGVGSRLDPRGIELYRRLLSRAGHAGAGLQMMSQWKLDAVYAGLKGLQPPLTLIVGEHDTAAPPAQARETAAQAGGAQVEVVTGVGHLAHEEAPERVAALIGAAAARAGISLTTEDGG